MEAMLKYTDNEMWTSKQYHLKCQNELGFEKAPHYHKYLEEQFPGLKKENKTLFVHHILGSASARKKYTDYLVIPLTIEEHAKAHKNLPLSFMMLLPRAIKLLIGYVQHLEENLYFKKLLEKHGIE
jgi:hypothetical protein